MKVVDDELTLQKSVTQAVLLSHDTFLNVPEWSMSLVGM